ncbi:hypothetical protein PSE10A_59250 [Pseudomonas amygdali pv. eriobotryae]|uniref:Uncharacterized protein n=1 Tax=Pseudomonas amygdali pv. eriobotryae TaxID=129137 RepID=A0A9P3AI56_PSEA0|nr:hypothetical protein PSE10A_59250 [Pseudomonas amygdali pv. eriobotryae]
MIILVIRIAKELYNQRSHVPHINTDSFGHLEVSESRPNSAAQTKRLGIEISCLIH